MKRHIAVDTQNIHHPYVTTANVTDRAGALEAFKNSHHSLSNVVNVLADGGYTGTTFANGVPDILNASVEIAKINEQNHFEVIPKRWIVERSFGWRDLCRRLCKNGERKLETSHKMVVFAFISLLLKIS